MWRCNVCRRTTTRGNARRSAELQPDGARGEARRFDSRRESSPAHLPYPFGPGSCVLYFRSCARLRPSVLCLCSACGGRIPLWCSCGVRRPPARFAPAPSRGRCAFVLWRAGRAAAGLCLGHRTVDARHSLTCSKVVLYGCTRYGTCKQAGLHTQQTDLLEERGRGELSALEPI